MKNLIGRALMIAMLASSLSAFAISDKSKAGKDGQSTDSAATTAGCPADQTAAGQDEAKADAERQRLIKEQEKQWLQEVDYAR